MEADANAGVTAQNTRVASSRATAATATTTLNVPAKTPKTAGAIAGRRKNSLVGMNTESALATKLMNRSDFSRLHCPKSEKQLLKLLSEVAVMDLADMNIAVKASALADIRLPQLLSHPLSIELLKDTLKRQLSPENMAFWIDIQKYRSIESPDYRKAIAEEIFHIYISDGALYEVNLSSTMKEGIVNKMTRYTTYNQDFAVSLFDDAEKEVFKLIQTNNFEALVQTPFFKLAAMALDHPDYTLKHTSRLQTVRMGLAAAFAKKNAPVAGLGADTNKSMLPVAMEKKTPHDNDMSKAGALPVTVPPSRAKSIVKQLPPLAPAASASGPVAPPRATEVAAALPPSTTLPAWNGPPNTSMGAGVTTAAVTAVRRGRPTSINTSGMISMKKLGRDASMSGGLEAADADTPLPGTPSLALEDEEPVTARAK